MNNFAFVSNIDCCTPVFGDHVSVIVDLNISVQKLDKQIVKRDWSRYSALDLNIAMHMRFASSTVNWAVLDVNEHWNALEDIIINCIDYQAPLKQFSDSEPKFERVNNVIKNKINKNNRLLKSSNTATTAPLIKNLNKEIKDYFVSRKVNKVKQAARGHKTNVWKAVKVAKNLCPVDIPSNLTVGGIPIAPGLYSFYYSTLNRFSLLVSISMVNTYP